MLRSLVAVTGFTALGLVIGACSSGEKIAKSEQALCEERGGCEQTCTYDMAKAGQCCTAEFEEKGICTTTSECDPRTEKCPSGDVPPDIAEPQKPGKSVCRGIDLSGDIKFHDFKDPITGKPVEWLGNTRLATWTPDKSDPRVGYVPCVHVDTFDAERVAPPSPVVYGGTTCKFVLDDQNNVPYYQSASGGQTIGRTGAYLRVNGSVFVPIGQRVEKPNGNSAGHWVTGVKAIETGGSSTWCLPGKGNDAAAATPEGTDLAATGMVEAANTNTNASGIPLQNVATRTVCTYSTPHPDGALYTGPGYYAGTHCYTDLGAAVNDNNGERDSAGFYYGADWSYHLVMSNGVQVPAAKRPSTRSYPAPGSVNERSYLLWLVVNSYVSIAN